MCSKCNSYGFMIRLQLKRTNSLLEIMRKTYKSILYFIQIFQNTLKSICILNTIIQSI